MYKVQTSAAPPYEWKYNWLEGNQLMAISGAYPHEMPVMERLVSLCRFYLKGETLPLGTKGKMPSDFFFCCEERLWNYYSLMFQRRSGLPLSLIDGKHGLGQSSCEVTLWVPESGDRAGCIFWEWVPWARCLGWVGAAAYIELSQVICLQEGINGIESRKYYGRKGDWAKSKGFRNLFRSVWSLWILSRQGRWCFPVHSEGVCERLTTNCRWGACIVITDSLQRWAYSVLLREWQTGAPRTGALRRLSWAGGEGSCCRHLCREWGLPAAGFLWVPAPPASSCYWWTIN